MPTITESGENISISTGSVMADPDAPWTLVTERFEEAKTNAKEMMDLLVGSDGNGGYLSQLRDAAEETLPSVDIMAPDVNTALSLKTATVGVPTFNPSDIWVVPNDIYDAPTLQSVPGIDSSGLVAALSDRPTAPTVEFSWTDIEYPTDVYDVLLPTILNSMSYVTSGIDPDVEGAIYDRAKERVRVDNEKLYNKYLQEWTGKQFQMPSGSLVSAMDDFYSVLARQVQAANVEILINQSDLAQKYRTFIIQQATTLEQLIRSTADAKANRALEYEKSRVTILIQIYSELVKGFAASLDAEAKYIEGQAAAIDGIVKSNSGKIEIYKEQYAALRTRVEASTSHNEGVVQIFQGQVQAYASNEQGVAEANKTQIDKLIASVQAAELTLRASIAEAEATTARYGAEQSVKEKVATGMAQIAAQSVAAWVGAVSAGAHLGYSGSESVSSSSSQSKSINVSHSYEHDPSS